MLPNFGSMVQQCSQQQRALQTALTVTAWAASNVGTGTAKIISTWVVEKGKPLATPAPK